MKLIAAEILCGTNEQAADVLMEFGFSSFIPGTFFATADDIQVFYGVSESYLTGELRRIGASPKFSPEDVVHDSPRSVAVRFRSKAHNRHEGYISGFQRLILSSRLMLALSVLMRCGRTIPNNSRIKTVYEELKSTDYAHAASRKKKAMECQQKAETAKSTARPLPPISDMVLTMADGRLTLSPEIFSKIISNGVSQGMSGV